jgi:hypothetical protein
MDYNRKKPSQQRLKVSLACFPIVGLNAEDDGDFLILQMRMIIDIIVFIDDGL